MAEQWWVPQLVGFPWWDVLFTLVLAQENVFLQGPGQVPGCKLWRRSDSGRRDSDA